MTPRAVTSQERHLPLVLFLYYAFILESIHKRSTKVVLFVSTCRCTEKPVREPVVSVRRCTKVKGGTKAGLPEGFPRTAMSHAGTLHNWKASEHHRVRSRLSTAGLAWIQRVLVGWRGKLLVTLLDEPSGMNLCARVPGVSLAPQDGPPCVGYMDVLPGVVVDQL
eukprot:6463089-Amphidinium_carterae.1